MLIVVLVAVHAHSLVHAAFCTTLLETAYVGTGFQISDQLAGHQDQFFNNKVIMQKDGAYTNGACSGDAMPIVHDNQVLEW